MDDSAEPSVDLADLRDFAQVVAEIRKSLANNGPTYSGVTNADGLYCAVCGDRRRMQIWRLYWRADVREGKPMEFARDPETPALFQMTCVQCRTGGIAVVYAGPDGPDLAILSSRRGGLSTPHTPESVAYYLDQAHRAESISATSAAAAMYRSALEMLLFEQGFTSGMLSRKIDDLLASSNPPQWREQIDSDYLPLLKNIGNGAMHPNDGDVTRQEVLDRKLLAELRVVFMELLDVVYERPAQTAARKAMLGSAVSGLVT